jgi:hypothetical protein
MTVVRPRIANKFAIPEFNEEEFSQFSEIVFSSGLQTADAFVEWEIRVTDVRMTLMVDPSTNLPGFWAQLQEVQEKKNGLVEIMMAALVQKGDWEGFVSSAERYGRQVRAKLVQDATVKAMKNKELQEARMYDMRADVFDVQHYCESTLVLVKTMLSAFDKKLDLLESANLNINRQITVAELLTYRGLL